MERGKKGRGEREQFLMGGGGGVILFLMPL